VPWAVAAAGDVFSMMRSRPSDLQMAEIVHLGPVFLDDGAGPHVINELVLGDKLPSRLDKIRNDLERTAANRD
jgi:hypothetical protein